MSALVKSTAGQPRHGADWNPYEILGLVPPASDRQIRAAYRRLARTMHPDNGGSEEAFRSLADAHDFLLDGVSRALWDRKHIRATAEKRQAACAALKQLCSEVVSFIVNGGTPPEYADIPAMMRKELRARLDKLAGMDSDTKRQIARHKLMVNTVTRRGGGENIVSEVLGRRLGELHKILAKIGEEAEIGEIMLVELTAYSSSVQADPAGSNGVWRSSWNEMSLRDVRFSTGGTI